MTHPSDDELQQFARGGLRPGRVQAVADHLQDCRRCGDAAIDAGHPSLEGELTPYAEGKLVAADAARVAAHVERCAICREDVADIRGAAALLVPDRHRLRWPYFVAAAAIAAMAVAALLMRDAAPAQPNRPPRITVTASPAPQPVEAKPPQRGEWTALVDRAVRTGAMAMPPALAELQLSADPQRAPADPGKQTVTPAGIIVETTRPVFEWTAVRGATYIVTVLDDDLETVMESGRLTAARWQPERELARGRVYQWQVSVRGAQSATIIPAPPAPPAVFRVLDAEAHQELARARASHSDDPLLLGVLAAQHGLRDEALRELAKVDTEAGRRLLLSVEAWR